MKDWSYHYERAEELLRKSDEPSLGFKREVMIAQAQVHAILATTRHEELLMQVVSPGFQLEHLPTLYADMPLFDEPNPDHTDD